MLSTLSENGKRCYANDVKFVMAQQDIDPYGLMEGLRCYVSLLKDLKACFEERKYLRYDHATIS